MTATPSTNPTLAHRTGGFDSLAAGLDYAAMGRTGCNFFSARGHLEQTLPYAELRESAVGLALRLGTLGLARGTRIAAVADTTPDFLIFFFACQYAGLVPVPLPLVNQIACCLYGAGYTDDMNQAKAIVAVETGSLAAA